MKKNAITSNLLKSILFFCMLFMMSISTNAQSKYAYVVKGDVRYFKLKIDKKFHYFSVSAPGTGTEGLLEYAKEISKDEWSEATVYVWEEEINNNDEQVGRLIAKIKNVPYVPAVIAAAQEKERKIKEKAKKIQEKKEQEIKSGPAKNRFHNDDVIEDENLIVAKADSGINISTSGVFTVGDKIELMTVVKANNEELIGCPIVFQIMEMRKSNLVGTEGRLTIRPLYIIDKNNHIVRLEAEDIYRRGKNRENIKTWLSPIAPPLVFIAGSRAQILSNETFELHLK